MVNEMEKEQLKKHLKLLEKFGIGLLILMAMVAGFIVGIHF